MAIMTILLNNNQHHIFQLKYIAAIHILDHIYEYINYDTQCLIIIQSVYFHYEKIQIILYFLNFYFLKQFYHNTI